MKSVSFVLLFFMSLICKANDLPMFCLAGPVDSLCVAVSYTHLTLPTT